MNTVRLGTLLVVLFGILPGVAAAEDSEQAPWRSLPLIEEGKVAPSWTHIGWGTFAVDDGSLRTDCDERGMGLLVYSKERLGNCQIRVLFRAKDEKSNSGVFIRIDDGILDWAKKESVAVKREANGKLSPEMLKKLMDASEREEGVWYAVHHGYEVQIMEEADAAHRTGALYSLTRAASTKPPANPWRTMIITLQGDGVHVDVDGQQVSDFDPAGKGVPPRTNWTEPKREHKRPQVGYIGLQNHDPGDVVYFKEVSVRPLPPTP